MNNLRRVFINLIQRYNRRFNSAYLENAYQASYLDLARRTCWLTDIPLSSPSGGTASFSLLYILLSILRDNVVSNIMEIGVGQSTKLLIQYTQNFNKNLTLLDDDESWLHEVVRECKGIKAVHAKLACCEVLNKAIQWYDCEPPLNKFDLLIVDGPMAYSRSISYNRLGILNWLPDIIQQEFIIIVDDTNRAGESMLVEQLLREFKALGVNVHRRNIVGGNSQTIIATPNFGKYLYL